MQKLLVTLGLCAAIFGSLSAAPASASPTLPLPPPRLALPDVKDLKLQAIPTLPLLPPALFRAELTAELFTKPVGPYYPNWHWIICVVRNTGLKDSGPFQTLITRIYAGTPALPGPAIATPVAMGNIPPGGYRTIVFAEHLSSALEVGAFADFTHVVPEYNELNNKDTLTVGP